MLWSTLHSAVHCLSALYSHGLNFFATHSVQSSSKFPPVHQKNESDDVKNTADVTLVNIDDKQIYSHKRGDLF